MVVIRATHCDRNHHQLINIAVIFSARYSIHFEIFYSLSDVETNTRESAIKAVRNKKMGLLKASKILPRTTLQRLAQSEKLSYQTGSIAINGFRATGIYPLDRNVFSDVNFASSSESPPDIESIQHANKKIRHSESRTIELISQEEENHGTTPISPISPVSINTSIIPQPDSEIFVEDLALPGPSGLNDNELEEHSNQTTRLSVSPRNRWPVSKPKKGFNKQRTKIREIGPHNIFTIQNVSFDQ